MSSRPSPRLATNPSAPQDLLTFPRGLVGTPQLRRFVLVEDERIAPCRWLQSLDEPAVAFVVVEPHLVLPEYSANVPDEDARRLELTDAGEAQLWTILTIQADPARSTANLLAPVVVNTRRRLAAQVILDGSGYAIRHPLTAVAPRGAPQASGAEATRC